MLLLLILPCAGLAQDLGEKVWLQEEIIAACAADMRSLPSHARYAVRYFDLSNLPPEERQTMPQILAGHINGLNREVDLVRLVQVKGAPVLRMNYEDAGWTAEVWEQLADAEPWFHVRIEKVFPGTVWPGGTWKDGVHYARGSFTYRARKITTEVAPWLLLGEAKKDLLQLILGTGSKAPVVRADWFLNQTAIQEGRVPGYYDFLGIKNQKDYESLIRFDADKSKDLKHRRAIIFSGITEEPRRVERRNTVLGGNWESFDNIKAVGKANPLQVLNGEFEFAVTEKIGTGPSNWPIFYLGDNQGNRADKAPDNIVHHPGPLNVNLNCLECHLRLKHENMLKDLNAVRIRTLDSPDYKKFLELKREYTRTEQFEEDMAGDRLKFGRVITRVTGMEPHEYGQAYYTAFNRYQRAKVGLAKAARDMGMAQEAVRKGWKDYQASGERLNQMLDLILQGGQIPIRQWEETFGLAQLSVRGLKQ